MYQHPFYDQSVGVDYDFSILRLDDSVTLPKIASFVKLPSDNDEAQAGEFMFVTGWGRTEITGESTPFLRGIIVPIYDFHKCKNSYERVNSDITDRMICAGYDEGGELIKLLLIFFY